MTLLDEVLDLSMDWCGKITRYIKPHLNTKEKISSTNASTRWRNHFPTLALNRSAVTEHVASTLTARPNIGPGRIRAIHLRTNLLPSKSIPLNQVPKRRCRAGCHKAESVSHILQQSPITNAPRIQKSLAFRTFGCSAQEAREKRWTVTEEPTIVNADGVLLKSDLLMVKEVPYHCLLPTVIRLASTVTLCLSNGCKTCFRTKTSISCSWMVST